MTIQNQNDWIIFSPLDVDLTKSPLRSTITEETFVLGSFNPGLTLLPNGNLLAIVRIAEALKKTRDSKYIYSLRWSEKTGYVIDKYPMNEVDTSDPRKYLWNKYKYTRVYTLTSISWLLPVEISPDGTEVVHEHYDKIITPSREFQSYGIEDARITKIDDTYFMTTCSVSHERQSTTLYTSADGLNYKYEAMILDHQNKDMVLFPEKIDGYYYALTRPWGDHYFAPVHGSFQGPSINLACSPDLKHWKPVEHDFGLGKADNRFIKMGAGTPPVKTDRGWLILFHGVELKGKVGVYKTYKAYLQYNEPWKIIEADFDNPVLSAEPSLTNDFKSMRYLYDVVFTCGITKSGKDFIIASGELDLCCRLTMISQEFLN